MENFLKDKPETDLMKAYKAADTAITAETEVSDPLVNDDSTSVVNELVNSNPPSSLVDDDDLLNNTLLIDDNFLSNIGL